MVRLATVIKKKKKTAKAPENYSRRVKGTDFRPHPPDKNLNFVSDRRREGPAMGPDRDPRGGRIYTVIAEQLTIIEYGGRATNRLFRTIITVGEVRRGLRTAEPPGRVMPPGGERGTRQPAADCSRTPGADRTAAGATIPPGVFLRLGLGDVYARRSVWICVR